VDVFFLSGGSFYGNFNSWGSEFLDGLKISFVAISAAHPVKPGAAIGPIGWFDEFIVRRDAEGFICPYFLHKYRPDRKRHLGTLPFAGTSEVCGTILPAYPNAGSEVGGNSYEPPVGITLCGSFFGGTSHCFAAASSAQCTGSGTEFCHTFHEFNHGVGIFFLHYFLHVAFHFCADAPVGILYPPDHFGLHIITIVGKSAVRTQHFINSNI